MSYFTGDVSRHHDTDHTVDETLDTGDGIKTNFTGRSLHFPIVFGTVQIEFTTGAGTFQVTESAGTFTHAQISAGTIDVNGNYDITFISPLVDTTLLKILDYSTKGLLTTLLELFSKAAIKITLGVGNGVTTVFGDTLTGSKIAKGQCRLIFAIQGVTFDLWDNGQGEWIDDLISASSLDYITKIVSVTFTIAPDDTKPVDTWHTDGDEGEDWIQLLGPRLQTDLTSTTEPDADQQKEVIIKNSGISFKEEIVIGLREFSRTADAVFAMAIILMQRWTNQDDSDGYFYFTGGAPHSPYNTNYNATYNDTTQSQKMVYTNDVMVYFVSATKSRVHIVISNGGTIYTAGSFGEGIRFSSPSKYNKPQYVAGNTTGFIPHSNTTLVG